MFTVPSPLNASSSYQDSHFRQDYVVETQCNLYNFDAIS